jgi:hypothetical protein
MKFVIEVLAAGTMLASSVATPAMYPNGLRR